MKSHASAPVKRRRRHIMEMSYVYVIAGRNVVKVGYSDNPEKRLRNIQSGTPYELWLASVHPVPKESARKVEAQIHHNLSAVHSFREWFRTSPSEAAQVVASTINGMEAPKMPLVVDGYITARWY